MKTIICIITGAAGLAAICPILWRRVAIRKRVRRRVEALTPTPTPNNCRECGRTCAAWHYGGKGCIHAAEIATKHNQ